jgi:signal peptidase I
MNVFKNTPSVLSEIVQTFLLAGSVFLVIYLFLFRPFQVSGSSMYPNFEDKEYVLTNIIGKNFSDPKRGDVVVFQSPTEPDKDFIKRVIGLPGDTIMLKEGDIYINDQKIDQSTFLSTDVKTFSGAFLKEAQPIVIPQDSYVVMGDNRGNSSDSREWGFIKKKDIVGQTLFVYWPPTKAKIIQNPLQ